MYTVIIMNDHIEHTKVSNNEVTVCKRWLQTTLKTHFQTVLFVLLALYDVTERGYS